MQFLTATALLTTLSLLTPSLADGIFAITGTGTPDGTVSLTVQNGNVGDAPKCQGSYTGSPVPTSGTIPCNDGYALSYTWNSVTEGISATYTNPSVTFTYNVPNNGVDGNGVYQFGFEDIFPGKKVRGFKA